MEPEPADSLDHFLRWRSTLEDPPVELDLSLGGLEEADVSQLGEELQRGLAAMARLEAGGVANVDENRMVGHYWLRAPGLAPDPEVSQAILGVVQDVREFAVAVHAGGIAPPEAERFKDVLLIGIGGSALGPMLVADALSRRDDPMRLHVMDNTDPSGFERVLAGLGDLSTTLVLVVSKSGNTVETRNGMLEVQRACKAADLSFAARAVAVTTEGSALCRQAREEGWLRLFPMWDWVGGRTSLWSAVGLLPAALIGLDVHALLAGAAAMDDATRRADVRRNPAAMLALFWHHEGGGRGARDMVVLPYKDRLQLLSRYLQQLVMESLGKGRDRQGHVVRQGITVYGNKGSTDQHAYVQQLRDGLHNSFLVFVRVLEDRQGPDTEVEPGITAGDYLDGSWQGTRKALYENGRHSATVTLDQLGERSLAALLALFERAVGLYAELVDVNAYNQPGVEAGKRELAATLELQARVWQALDGSPRTCVAIARMVGAPPATVWCVLRHLAVNRPELHARGHDPEQATFWLISDRTSGGET